jgi:hypothetical protein
MKNNSPRTVVLILIVSITAFMRVINTPGHTPMSNFTPIGTMALFSGKHFLSRWMSYIFPLLTLWISDLFVNYFVYYNEWIWFYDGFYWTYGSFALIIFLGSLIKRVNLMNVLLACVGAALLHWIISNFGVWMRGGMYPDTIEGLFACYMVAIPYMLYTLAGNIVFSLLIFGIFEWMVQKYPSLQLARQK